MCRVPPHQDCARATCVTYMCGIPSLEVEQHVAIYVRIDVVMPTMAKYGVCALLVDDLFVE